MLVNDQKLGPARLDFIAADGRSCAIEIKVF
jgi:hypothetical protein